MRIRDAHPMFDEVRARGRLGMLCVVVGEGEVDVSVGRGIAGSRGGS